MNVKKMNNYRTFKSFQITYKGNEYKWNIIKFIFLIFILIIFIYYNNLFNENKNINYNLDYILKYNNTFIVLRYKDKISGLFYFFLTFTQCINTYINKGYIPIIDLLSYPNIFNGFNVSSLNKNPWEFFFEQPFSFSLDEVKKNANKVIYINYNKALCKEYGPIYSFKSRANLDYLNMIVLKYIPIKKDIIIESNILIKKLFKGNNKNVLGILLRGTDYLAKKPKKHPIQPSTEIVINDVIKADKQNRYDYIFITTEDELILEKFKNRFVNKLKYYKDNHINYNYTKKKYLAFNENVLGNITFHKIYLINIIILSKCIDIISSKAGGLWGAMILSKGFRNYKIYSLGYYK